MAEPFNPREHLIELKSKQGSQEYLPVQWRLVWVNEHCPELKITIVDKIIDPDREVEKEVYQWNNDTRRSEKILKKARGWAWFHVRVEDGKGKVGEAFKAESAVDFDDYIEKADTGATGRALAKIGWGTQFVGTDFDELPDRIVDAPVSRQNDHPAPQSANTSNVPPKSQGTPTTTTETKNDTLATEQQLVSLRKLNQHLGKPDEPVRLESLTYQEAKALITQLSHEYNEQKQNRKATPVVVEQSKPEPTHDKQVPAAIQRMIDVAKSRCEKLGKAWVSAKAEALGEVKEDYEIVIGDFTKINGLISKWEREPRQSPESLTLV